VSVSSRINFKASQTTGKGYGPGNDRFAAFIVLGVASLWLFLCVGAATAAALNRSPMLPVSISAPFLTFTQPSDPSAVWGQQVGPPWLYWGSTAVLTIVGAGASCWLWLLWRRTCEAAADDPREISGVASSAEVMRTTGRRRLLRRARVLRPSLPQPTPLDLGYLLGRARGRECFSSVEDSIILLGPPRSGKGLHLVIPSILDAPGAVITTSTRPDNLTATLRARQGIGPVAVFDPQSLAPGIPSSTRWSPIRGCDNPQIALLRAKALASGAAGGTVDSNFWQASSEQAVRCLLHAAALGGRTPTDLYRWSLSAVQAREAVAILASDPRAALSWDQALESIVSADPRQRDSVWAMVSIAFSALADPRVLEALSPAEGEEFDPETFLRSKGTVYLLGTATGAAATGGLVGAFVEDVVGAARRLAAASPGARLDPPLSLLLDEAANYPLPSLTSLMSEGGGTGISTMVVLQSLAQARSVWGEHAASAVWDAAIVKIVLGGGSTARDLDDLSRLIGQREEFQASSNTAADGRRSVSTSTVRVPIMEPHRLRTLPFGTAVLLLRSSKPIVLSMTPWIDRRDSKHLRASRAELEGVIQRAYAEAG